MNSSGFATRTTLAAIVVAAGWSAVGVDNGAFAAPASEAIGGANAPKVRVAVHYTIDGQSVVRSKGITKVTNPTAGVYCVRLSAGSGIADAATTIPMVSVEYDSSKDNGASSFAVVATGGSDCPNTVKWIGVRTYGTDGDASDDASWFLIVP